MKEATGELSMTVVVIIAVIAIIGVLTVFLLPKLGEYLGTTWGNMSGKNCHTNPETGVITCDE